MDLVLILLWSRNHGIIPDNVDIFGYGSGGATYDLPRDVAEEHGLSASLVHPKAVTQYTGLYFMAGRGARLVRVIP